MVANIINKYLDEIDVLKEQIDDDIDELLEKIDVGELIKDPHLYLEELSKQYYESHVEILNKALEIGENQAVRVLKEIGKA
jgi:predicted transcriptional regulator